MEKEPKRNFFSFQEAGEAVRPTELLFQPKEEELTISGPEKSLSQDGLETGQENAGFVLSPAEQTEGAVPKEKNFKELYQIGQSQQLSADHLREILAYEQEQGRLEPDQFLTLKEKIKDFEPQQIIKDMLWPAVIQAGLYGGAVVGSLAGHIPLPATIAFFSAVTVFPISLSGILRLPVLNLRAGIEIKKISQSKGFKAGLKIIPFYLGLNILSLIPLVDWMAFPLLSLPRNKDLGLVFINHRLQTSKAPKILKNLFGKGVKKLLAK